MATFAGKFKSLIDKLLSENWSFNKRLTPDRDLAQAEDNKNDQPLKIWLFNRLNLLTEDLRSQVAPASLI